MAVVSELPKTTDVLVVGGGIVGVSLARELRRRHPDLRVIVIEKEPALGMHASGRNSGVLHAGFYYHADSLKARLTRDGNASLQAYCKEHGLPLNSCGKLVVAQREADHPALDELTRRAKVNGVVLQQVTEAEAREIEPRARTVGRALFSPSTATVDPRRVLDRMAGDARAHGISILQGVAYLERKRGKVRTSAGEISPGYVVNTAGLHADRVARDFGFARDHRIVPFRGRYLYSREGSERLGTHVYPVPDLRMPFLGAHLTVAVDGRVKIGPTATPGLWREHYGGLKGFSLRDAIEIVRQESRLFLRGTDGFRALAWEEIRKLTRKGLLRRASRLVTGVGPVSAWDWGAPGIRAQLVDIRNGRLEMDFRYEGDDSSFHVLNAVSPAFTCALSFAELLVSEIERLWASQPLGQGSTNAKDQPM